LPNQFIIGNRRLLALLFAFLHIPYMGVKHFLSPIYSTIR
jgi:hypothetical protein